MYIDEINLLEEKGHLYISTYPLNWWISFSTADHIISQQQITADLIEQQLELFGVPNRDIYIYIHIQLRVPQTRVGISYQTYTNKQTYTSHPLLLLSSRFITGSNKSTFSQHQKNHTKSPRDIHNSQPIPSIHPSKMNTFVRRLSTLPKHIIREPHPFFIHPTTIKPQPVALKFYTSRFGRAAAMYVSESTFILYIGERGN